MLLEHTVTPPSLDKATGSQSVSRRSSALCQVHNQTSSSLSSCDKPIMTSLEADLSPFFPSIVRVSHHAAVRLLSALSAQLLAEKSKVFLPLSAGVSSRWRLAASHDFSICSSQTGDGFGQIGLDPRSQSYKMLAGAKMEPRSP